MRNAASFKGHCQLCGSLQKLPGGFLSLHGYTVQHGFFSGICGGSRSLPFEQSCDLIEEQIVRASRARASLQERAQTLRTVVDASTKMWVSTYVKGTYMVRSHYVWEQVELAAVITSTDADGWRRIAYSYTDGQGKKHDNLNFDGVAPYEMPNATAEELRQASVLKHNARYAETLDDEAATLARYIVWQTKRVAEWAPAPLLPVETKNDKTGFDPDAK